MPRDNKNGPQKLENLNEGSPYSPRLSDEGESKPEKLKSSIIFWKHNIENNEKYFKKELAARSKDLGVKNKLTTIWLRDFNIGNTMHIKPVSYRKLTEKNNFEDYFGVNIVVEIVLTYSCCLFSIATENRFICQKEFENENSQNELRGPVKQVTKIYKLQSNKNFVRSESFHFKAIEILCAFVEDCPLLNHLIASYQKNYFPNLEAIPEEENS